MKWHVVSGLLLKYWYITKNRLDRIFDIFYWPLISLLIWGFTTYYIRDFAGSKILMFFIGGTVLWVFFQRAMQDITVYVLEDFWGWNLYNTFASPVTWKELLFSVISFGVIRAVITFLFLAAIAGLMFAFNIFSAGIFAIALYSLGLLMLGWVFGIFVAGLIFIKGLKIQVFAWSFAWLLQPFSCVFYPLASLPVWLQKASLIFPTTHIFEGMRYSMETGRMAWNSFIYAMIINIILLIAMCIFFRQALKHARKKGLLTRRE